MVKNDYIASMKILQSIFGLLLLVLQLVLMYLDRFVCAFLPWMDLIPVSTNLLPLKQIVNSMIRVSVGLLIYWMVC